MKSHLFFIFIVIVLLLTNIASAGLIDSAKDVVDAVKEAKEIAEFVYGLLLLKIWNGDWGVAKDEGKPKKNTKSKEHIRAWIDITGFRNESVINGTRYVDGEAKDFAIVKRKAWHTRHIGMVVVSFKSKLTMTDSMELDGNITTTATQRTDFHWKRWQRTRYGGYWKHVYENLIISCTVDAPKNLTTRIPDVKVNVLFYNRSVAPVTYLFIPIESHSSMKDVMIVNVTYNGSSVHRYDQIGEVWANDRGAEYVQFIDDGWYPLWIKDANQSEIDHCGRMVTVFDPEFNMSLLNISLHAPYETRYVTNYSVKTVSGNAKIPMLFIKILLLLIGAIVGLVIIWRVAKRELF